MATDGLLLTPERGGGFCELRLAFFESSHLKGRHQMTVDTESYLMVPIKNIVTDNENRAEADIENLAASIKAAGLRQPIGVAKKGGKYRLVYGHRRLAACKSLGKTHIRAEDLGPIDDEDIMQLRAVENLDRKDLSPVEEAVAVAALVGKLKPNGGIGGGAFDANAAAAKKLGKTTAFVRDRMYLIERCSKAVMDLALNDKRITVGHLRELAKVGDKPMQLRLAGNIVDERKNWKTKKIADARIQSIEDLREAIDSSQRALDRVPWLLDKKVGKQPACLGCKSNTATDETLFGTDHKGEDVGFCMNEGCYRNKEREIEKAKKVVAEKIGRLKEPSSDKAVVESKMPDYMKVATAQRYVRLNVKGIDKAKKAAAKKAGKTPAAAKKKAGADPNQGVLKKHEDAYRKWAVASADAINKAIVKQNPMAVLAAHLLSELRLKGRAALNKVDSYYGPVDKDWNTSTHGYVLKMRDGKPKPMTPGAEAELKKIIHATMKDIEVMAREGANGTQGYYTRVMDDNDSPHMLASAANLVGVELKDAPEAPELVKAEPTPKKKKKAAKKKK